MKNTGRPNMTWLITWLTQSIPNPLQMTPPLFFTRTCFDLQLNWCDPSARLPLQKNPIPPQTTPFTPIGPYKLILKILKNSKPFEPMDCVGCICLRALHTSSTLKFVSNSSFTSGVTRVVTALRLASKLFRWSTWRWLRSNQGWCPQLPPGLLSKCHLDSWVP